MAQHVALVEAVGVLKLKLATSKACVSFIISLLSRVILAMCSVTIIYRITDAMLARTVCNHLLLAQICHKSCLKQSVAYKKNLFVHFVN